MLDAVELLIILPLLFGLLHFMTPAVRYISCYSRKMQCQFGVIPVLYYVFDYLTRVYTDLLSSGAPVVVEFMHLSVVERILCSCCITLQKDRKKTG